MLRTLVRSALVAALVTGGSLLVEQPASAQPTGSAPCGPGDTRRQCKNDPPRVTGCNSNNPGKGCPTKQGSTSPVCGKGNAVGNPHCRPGSGPGSGPGTGPGTGPGAVLGGTLTQGGSTVRSANASQVRAANVAKARRTQAANVAKARRAKAAANRKAPRSVKAAAPRRGPAVVTRAGKTL